MTTDYEALSKHNEEQLGKDRKSRMSQVAMYADTAHFVYELLQNADDVGATEIHFKVTASQLLVEHNAEKVFDDENVRAISYFGMGKTDITKIGHFGLGFKSVFAYTASPQIHSGRESFAITDLYSVHAVSHPEDLAPGRTRFVLPFDHERIKPDYIERVRLKSPRIAYKEIADKLADLGPTTLLFMKTLRKILWSTENDGEGHYARTDKPVDDATEIRITTGETFIANGAEEETCYLVFTRPVSWPDENEIDRERRPVQIAFQVTTQQDGERIITPIERPPLYVFFPTEKEMHVGFIVQGPYRTTPARDNVPEDDDFNRHLANQTADLLVKTLMQLKRQRLLTLEVISLLPLNYHNFPADSLFHPIHAAVREALLSQPLLPTTTRGYISADHAKLPRAAWIIKAFPPAQLDELFGTEGMKWLDSDLTKNEHPDLHRLLVGEKRVDSPLEWIVPPLAPDIEVRPERIAENLEAEFLIQQTDEWLRRFYSIIGEERASNYFLRCPYLRLSDDSLVVPNSSSDSPSVFLPFDDDEACRGLPVIKRALLTDKKARTFLEKALGLKTPDLVDVLCSAILPRYEKKTKPTVTDWRKHFTLVVQAMRDVSPSKRQKLVEALAKASFIRSVRPGYDEKLDWAKIKETYENTDDLEAFFAGNDSAFFLAPKTYSESDVAALRELGVADAPRVEKKPTNHQGNVVIRNWHGMHSRGHEGFDPDWKMDGLEFAVENPTLARSRLLWSYLLLHWQCIRGIIESASRQNYDNSERREEISDTGQLLIDSAWLPDKRGQWHKPSELSLDELPDDFEKSSQSADNLAIKLSMQRPEEQQAVISLAKGNERKQRLLELLAHADNAMLAKFEKLAIKTEPKTIEAISFKEGFRSFDRQQNRTADVSDVLPSGVKNPQQYQEKANELALAAKSEAGKEPVPKRFSIVLVTSSTKDAREFLYSQYAGKCQISGATFLKRNGKNYFEAVCIVPRKDAEYFNDPGNMLCLSAEVAAKVVHASFEWIDNIESKISAFKAEAEGGSVMCVEQCSRAGVVCVIGSWRKSSCGSSDKDVEDGSE